MSFFTDSAVSDKIQELNIEGVYWMKPWELVKKLPSLKKISYTVYRRCTRDLSQLLGYCKNLSPLEIFTDNIVWLDPGRGTKSVKLPKLKHFVI